MRLYFILLSIACTMITYKASSQVSSSIEWGAPIQYDDFESSPGKTDTAAANISVTILLGYSNTKSGQLKFKVVAVMDKNESWIRDEFKRNHILKHEQGHFDIAHIYAKRLEANLKDKRYTANDIQSLNVLYDRFLDEMNQLQIRYDVETKGGWDALAQSKWRRFLARELAGVQ